MRTHTRGQAGSSPTVAPPLKPRAREVGPVTNRRYSGLLAFLSHRQPASEGVTPTGIGFTAAFAACTPLAHAGRGVAACELDHTLRPASATARPRTPEGHRSRPAGSRLLVSCRHPEVASPSGREQQLE